MAGKLIIQETDGGLQINGITDYDDGVELLVGTGAVGKPIEMGVKEAAAKLPAAVRLSVAGGTQVMEGLIKFAKPIFIKGASLRDTSPPATVPAKPSPKPQVTKSAAYTLDDTGYRALLRILDDVAEGEEHIKAAAHPFHDYLVESIENAKVDGRTVGFNVPVKVAFRDDATRDLFMNWFGQVQRKKAVVGLTELVKAAAADKPVDVEALASFLAASGAVKSPLRTLAG